MASYYEFGDLAPEHNLAVNVMPRMTQPVVDTAITGQLASLPYIIEPQLAHMASRMSCKIHRWQLVL